MNESEFERRWDRCRVCARWLDGVKNLCNARSLELSVDRMTCKNRELLRDFEKGTNGTENV